MAQVAFSELVPEVLATAPACPVPTVVRTLRNAARKLCEDTDCYRIELDNTVVIKGQPNIELALPPDTALHRPITLTLAGKRLAPISQTLLEADEPDWRSWSDVPRYWMRNQDELDGIRLVPSPEQTYTTNALVGEVAIKPSRAATGVEEIFFDRFYDVFIDGALAKILAIRSAPWYAPDLAVFHAQAYEDAKDEARRVADGDDRPKLRVVKYGGI